MFTFTHEPLQFFSLAAQLEMHWLAEQTSPAAQAWPHDPQLVESLSVLMHAVPHLANPWLQVLPQVPALQVAIPPAGASQTCPHAPQFSGSELVSMQLAPQALYPLSQLKLQVAATQLAEPCCGVGHALSQPPQ
ncbi:MAG: hypothetical protein ABJB12_01700 [Pseudomonadota bacterium]